MAIRISFLGGCREIGRSAVLVESARTGDKILLDYGVKMDGTDDNFPEHISGKELTAIVVTHSHIDHVGGVPIFYISGRIPLYMTELTFEVSDILLRDMMKISSFYLPFDEKVLERMAKFLVPVRFGHRLKVGKGSFITFYNNGHIPGSAMVLLEIEGKRILYTGDFNTIETQLMRPAVPPPEPVDIIITESTYGNTEHEAREKVEKDFIEHVEQTLENRGRVLVPAFGVARSQEILMVLNKYNMDYPIFLDGMARTIGKIYGRYPGYFRSWKELENALERCHFIDQRKTAADREKAKNTRGIIIAPSGMLKGGTARLYAESIYKDPNSAIYLVSYQLPDSPGGILLNEHKYLLDPGNPNSKEDVICDVQFFDFSSHSGHSELLEFIEGCSFRNGDHTIFVIHGEPEAADVFSRDLRTRGYSAVVPRKGEFFNFY